MRHHVHADPTLQPGTLVMTVGNTQRLIVAEEIGPRFRASSNDADVWGLERGSAYHAVTGRDATAEEQADYDLAQNPRGALYRLVMRRGRAFESTKVQLHLANLSSDIFAGTQNLHLNGEEIVATSYTHIYDGDDIRRARALALSELPAGYAAQARELIAQAQAAREEADDPDTL